MLAWDNEAGIDRTENMQSFSLLFAPDAVLFHCSTEIISSNPGLFLNSLLGTLVL